MNGKKRSESSGGRVNISTLYSVHSLVFFFPFLPPAFRSPSLVVSQPSVIPSQSLLHQRLGFQNGALLFSFLGTQLCCLSLYLVKKKKKTDFTSEKKDMRMKGDAQNPLTRRNVEVQFTVLILIFRSFSVVLMTRL